jgi:cell division transport system permease protein
MALNVEYVFRETVSNLRRNVSMASAALLTVAVSLTLVGGALLVKRGVDRATVQWKGNVELSIFMKADAAQSESDAVDRQLKSMPEVKSYRYVSKPEAFEEFKKIFANEPDVRDSLTVDQIPPSYRVVPRQAEQTKVIGQRFDDTAGVFRVSYAKEEVDALVSVTSFLQIMLWAIAAVLLSAASLLILNTIRMAIFARRREVAVMKLVGATNWFIRIPFMLEGFIQGLLGSLAAVVSIYIFNGLLTDQLSEEGVGLLADFVVPSSHLAPLSFLLVLAGVTVAILCSGVAASRYLDV